MCLAQTKTKTKDSFWCLPNPFGADMAVASRGHYCSSLCTEDVLSLDPRSRAKYLNTDCFIFQKHSESSDSSHFPCVCVHSTFQSVIFFFFLPTFAVCLSGWDYRLGSAAAEQLFFSHFVVLECSTDFFFFFFCSVLPLLCHGDPGSSLPIVMCYFPPYYILSTWLFSSYHFEEKCEHSSPVDSMLLRQYYLDLAAAHLSNYFKNISQLFSLFLYIYHVSH